MNACPGCARPVALTRPTCLYCGAALGAEQVAAAEKSAALAQAPAAEAAPSERQLVVLAAADCPREVLAGALGLSLFEADQRRRRAGFHLHRICGPHEAAAEAERLRAAGVPAVVVPEVEARAALQPHLAQGGRWEGDVLRLRFDAEADRRLEAGAVLLVVKGPIARAPESDPKMMRTAGRLFPFATTRVFTPPQGERIHLHLHGEARPLELDPESFDFGAAPLAGSTTLQLKEWVAAAAAGAPVDDSFRHLTPALGPAEQPRDGPARALARLRGEEAGYFDNVSQFRFFSGWRAAVERRPWGSGGEAA